MVEAHQQGSGAGPDPDDLHFDLFGLNGNPWNTQIFECLLEKFKILQVQQHSTLKRTDEYIRDMFLEKYKRCKGRWFERRARVKKDGQLETRAELTARVEKTVEDGLKAQRHCQRRHSVNALPFHAY